MFDAMAMQQQAAYDMGTLGLTDTRAPGEMDELLRQYHQHLVLPRFHKQFELSEYLETFMNELLQRLREAELLRDENPKAVATRLAEGVKRQEARIDELNNEVRELKADVERLRVPQQPRHQHRSVEEQVRAAQYAAYRTRGSSRRTPSRDGSYRSGTEENGLPGSAEVLYDAVCRSLREGRARGSHPVASAAGDSNAPSTPTAGLWYPSDYDPHGYSNTPSTPTAGLW